MRAELTVTAYVDCRNRPALIDSVDAGNEGLPLSAASADVNCVRLTGSTAVADIDIVTLAGEIYTSRNAQCDSSQPISQSDESRESLPVDRPGNLASNRRGDHPLRGRLRYGRNYQWHRAFSQGTELADPNRWRRPNGFDPL